jgi:acetyl esterase/lipase
MNTELKLSTTFFVLLLAMAKAELPDLSSVTPDLVTPITEGIAPAPGKRVRQTTSGWEGTEVHHTLYLPRDWKAGAKHPVIVEYAGNGGYKNKFGDVSEGTVEGSNLGYGLSGGQKFIWVCMPYIETKNGRKQNAALWWGDVEETKRYCLATVSDVCAKHGGDSSRVVLAGFSRGSIGCNFIGLHDDEISKLWRAFICHSHYDGVRESWPYAGADRASALVRLKRLQGRPQWISHEGGAEATKDYLEQTGVKGDFTFVTMPFRNHSDQWALRDIPERKQAREWLARVIGL